MAKNKKKQEKGHPAVACQEMERPADPAALEDALPAPAMHGHPAEELPEPPAAAPLLPAPAPLSRWRRLAPDLAKAVLALAVIGVGASIWYMPPLIRADFPYVTYRFRGQTLADAALYRPLAMPTRFYIALPHELEGRYAWFAVDRRREVAALAEAPRHRYLGRSAIKRSEPLGLDLEFRKLDNSEWQVHFLDEAIVFSNAVLTVRLDTRQEPSPPVQ